MQVFLIYQITDEVLQVLTPLVHTPTKQCLVTVIIKNLIFISKNSIENPIYLQIFQVGIFYYICFTVFPEFFENVLDMMLFLPLKYFSMCLLKMQTWLQNHSPVTKIKKLTSIQ